MSADAAVGELGEDVAGVEAVTLRRQLAAADPAAYTPNLAAALANQAKGRGEIGDRAGALMSPGAGVARG